MVNDNEFLEEKGIASNSGSHTKILYEKSYAFGCKRYIQVFCLRKVNEYVQKSMIFKPKYSQKLQSSGSIISELSLFKHEIFFFYL